jgi:hypothetical protein
MVVPGNIQCLLACEANATLPARHTLAPHIGRNTASGCDGRTCCTQHLLN